MTLYTSFFLLFTYKCQCSYFMISSDVWIIINVSIKTTIKQLGSKMRVAALDPFPTRLGVILASLFIFVALDCVVGIQSNPFFTSSSHKHNPNGQRHSLESSSLLADQRIRMRDSSVLSSSSSRVRSYKMGAVLSSTSSTEYFQRVSGFEISMPIDSN